MLYIKFILVLIVYIFLLFTISPIIDHAFTELNKDESNLEILSEIILQLVTVTIVWFILDEYIMKNVVKQIDFKRGKLFNKSIEITSALIMVGLQTHLISKLKYITHEHPFRLLTLPY